MRYSKVVRLGLALVVAGALIIPLLSAARAPPLIPYEAFGIARNSSGASLGINQPIRTFIDGVDYSNLTSTYRADGSYQTQIVGNYYIGPTSETPALKEGGDPLDPIMFSHGDMTASGVVFQETAVWNQATFQNRDLTEALAASQPALIKIQTITTRPADTLSQYAYLCNPTASPVDLARYYFERDIPGNFLGPRVSLTGTLGAGQKIFGDFLSTAYLTNNGDALKLVFDTTPVGGAPNGGADIVVDRVEFNASSGGALFWEPGNTIMTDAPAPGLGGEIHRTAACTDTNQGVDFTTGTETGRPTSPVVVLLTPDGGERWTGGTPHAITWTMSDAQDPNTALVVNISYSTDSGATFPNPITTGRPGTAGTNTYNWNPIPSFDTSTARVLVCARDTTGLLGCDASGNDFAIDDTFPSVTARNPTPGQTGVPVNADVVVTFSEGMDPASVQGPSGFSWSDAATPSYSWAGNVLTVSHTTPFAAGASVNVVIGTGARDLSDPGKNLIPAVSWSFTTFLNNAPSVAISTPIGGECWSGGVGHNIMWTMNDPETPTGLQVTLTYTSSAGNGPIIGPLTDATSYLWTPSGLNAPDVQILVRVQDPDGGSRTAQSNPIQVDSNAPTMTSTPANGATGVPLTPPVTIVFTEGMDQTAVRNGFQIAKVAGGQLVGGIAFNWNGNTATVTHAPFEASTAYIATLSGARDDCDPGLLLAGPTSFNFTTSSTPTATITAPTAGVQFAPGSTITITWTMSDPETPTANLVVYLNYTSSAGNGQISGRLVGVQTYPWVAPSIDSSNVKIVLTVIDADGSSTTVESGAFAIRPATGLDLITIGVILGIILAVIIIALLWFLVFAKRRKKEETPPRLVVPATVAPPPRAVAPPPVRAAPPPPGAPAPPSGGTKECPQCGTIIDRKDPECFMCGHKF